jgi:guanylate kinase
MRNTNHEDDIRARLGIATKELEQKSEFDYIVVNDDLEQCKHALIKLIKDIVSGKRDVPCSSSS